MEQRCLPYRKTKSGQYMFNDTIFRFDDKCDGKEDEEVWEQLRYRPFRDGKIMDDNLGYAYVPAMGKDHYGYDWKCIGNIPFTEFI